MIFPRHKDTAMTNAEMQFFILVPHLLERIATALETHTKLEDVQEVFKDVQNITHCSTGCGGCYQKVLDVISEVLMG